MSDSDDFNPAIPTKSRNMESDEDRDKKESSPENIVKISRKTDESSLSDEIQSHILNLNKNKKTKRRRRVILACDQSSDEEIKVYLKPKQKLETLRSDCNSLASFRTSVSEDESLSGSQKVISKRLEDFEKEIYVNEPTILKIQSPAESRDHIVHSLQELKTEQSLPKTNGRYLLLSDGDLTDDSGDDMRVEDKHSPDKSLKCKEKSAKNIRKRCKKVKSKADDEAEDKLKKARRKKKVNNSKKISHNSESCESKHIRKAAKDAMVEIKSTTQKMIREGRISLPYHQPKQRSLEEFLLRRNKTVSIPLKPSLHNLNIIAEKLKKKEEEVSEFFRSESEHSDFDELPEKTAPLADSPKDPQQESQMHISECSGINFGNCEVTVNHDLNSDCVVNCNSYPEMDIVANESDSHSAVSDLQNEKNLVKNNYASVIPVDSCAELDVNHEISSECGDVSVLSKEKAVNIITTFEKSSIAQIELNQGKTYPISEDYSEARAPSDSCTSDFNLEITDSQVDEVSTNVSPYLSTISEATINNDTKVSISEIPDSCLFDFSLKIQDSDTILGSTKSQAPMRKSDHETENHSDVAVENNVDLLTNDEKNNSVNLATNCDSKPNPNLIRDRKLELLSKLNIDLSTSVALNNESNKELVFEVVGSENPGIEQFLQKFMRHTAAEKRHVQKERTLNILKTKSDQNGEIIDVVKETLHLKNDDDLPETNFTIPGSKYQFLKSTMLKTLITKKQANWKEYQREKRRMYASDEEVDLDDNEIDEFASRKLNFEPYHPEEEPEDEDLVEDDVDMHDTRDKSKNEFLDDEAEVSFDEDENVVGCHNEEDTDIENSDEEKYDEISESESDLKLQTKKKESDDTTPADDGKVKITQSPEKLFRNEMSANDLEDKVLGLNRINSQNVDETTLSQIYSVCSGKFVTQPILPTQDENISQFSFGDDSQDLNLSVIDTPNDLDNFEDAAESLKSNVIMSDESDTEELFVKRKKTMIIHESDNEDNLEESSSEKIDEVVSNDGEDGVADEENGNEFDEIGYNSEEELVNYGEKLVPTDFFENEAVLSESEWGSEDENEKGLDELEKEAGDDDDLDTEKLKKELGKIHMRQLLDDDQQDVRLLKEMLLEDGEFHSDTKRSRKFQWKNLDGDDFFSAAYIDSDDETTPINDNDAENEENWRKIRHEREIFLSKQEKKQELLLVEDEEIGCFVHLGRTKISTAIGCVMPSKPSLQSASPNAKLSMNTKFKCGSFLSRKKIILERIAGNVSDQKDNIKGPTNSRNFVFAAISPEKKDIAESGLPKPEKRKTGKGVAAVTKKLRLSTADTKHPSILKNGFLAQLALSD